MTARRGSVAPNPSGGAERRPSSGTYNISRHRVMVNVGIGSQLLTPGVAAGMRRALPAWEPTSCVPRGTLVKSRRACLRFSRPTRPRCGLAKTLVSIAGVAQASPQRILPMLVNGQPANVIAFDPAHDSSILNWLENRQEGTPRRRYHRRRAASRHPAPSSASAECR